MQPVSLSPTGSGSSGQAVPKKIGVGHILKIINEVYGSRVTVQGEQTIPLQQKLAICTLLLLRKRGTKKQITLGKVCCLVSFPGRLAIQSYLVTVNCMIH